MDDLDHSIHIAEFDWTIFYDESEECSLLQPSLACPDDSRLSDSEDSENLGSKSTTGQQETEHSPDVNSFGVDSNSAGCSTGEEACIKLDESSSRGEQGAEDRVTQVDSETCLGHPAGKTNEVHKQTAENTVQTETAVPEELKKDGDNGDLHTETNNSSNESNLLFVSQTELHMNEPLATDRAVREDWSSVTPRAEKERWFVTVNDSPSRRQTHASSVKKKRRQKKLCKNSATTATNMCNYRRNRREKSLENGLELEINKHKNDSEGDRDTGDLTQSNHKMVQMSDRHHSDATNPDSISDLSQMSCDEDSMSDKLLISDSPKEIETIEPVIDRNKHEPGSSASTSHDTFTLTDPSQLESAMSDEVEDAAEFFSIHSYDSESYLSAAESMEETQHALLENLRHVDLIHSQCSESLVESAVTADKGQTHTCDSVPSCNVSATDCDSYEHTDVEPTLPFLYADQKANEMPDDNSTCDNKTHSTVPHMLSDTPGAQEHKINFSASGCSSGDQLSLFSVPDLTLTPCSVADNPEAYAEAAGNTRPVYAISAFWDEMEKLTINDILQLRMGRSSSLTDTRETVSADVDDSLTSQSPLTDTAQYNLSDVGLMDTSDTADSDYFTQTDESKPDRSSCEFSTSDFDEEYWQFLGTSENSSPDPHSKNQTSDCPSLSYEEEEEESTSSEGKETPVPSEDFAGQGFEDQESNSLSKLDKMGPQHMTKSKSMYNIQALNKEDLISSFGDNNNSLFLSSCQSLEKNMVLKVNDNLGTPIPEPFLSTYSDELWKMSYPEVFEYFFMEDRAKTDSTCVSVYNPEDISVFDCTFGTLRDDMSFFSLRDSLCREEKPIPIFSSIREITLPQSDCVFLSADCEVGDLSPIKVVSCAFIQGNGCGAAAGGSHGWKSLLSMRKIRFHDKGSIWCRRSGGWVFPVEAEKTEKNDPLNSVLTEGRICTTSPQLFTDLTVQQSILQTIQTTRREGIFSTLKQSDMCLVCIAFASWVLRSSDPEAADTWKAALLANVSALSAIQYLRQYVKKKSPPQDHP